MIKQNKTKKCMKNKNNNRESAQCPSIVSGIGVKTKKNKTKKIKKSKIKNEIYLSKKNKINGVKCREQHTVYAKNDKKKRKRSKEKIVQRSEVKRRNRCGMTSD